MVNFLLIIAFLYFILNASLIILWLKMPFFKILPTENKLGETFISVIIPVRNEAKGIRFLLEDLEKQTYPKDKFEVIIADDDSTDATVAIVNNFAKNNYISLIVNQLKDKRGNTSPKKRAINASIEMAKGELIATTDGDCRVGVKWLETINDFYQITQAQLISGAVTFQSQFSTENVSDKGVQLSVVQRFFTDCQIVEFASLIGTGASAMSADKPNMCNGANLTYQKTAFYEVGGFAGNENLASGDDEFLMHKIAARYPKKVYFLKNIEAIVETNAHHSWRSFYNQRKRWASKWRHYQNPLTILLAVFIFLANLALPLAIGCWEFKLMPTLEFILFLGLKFSAEFVFLTLIVNYLQKSYVIWLIPLVQIIYPFYVIFFGLIAQRKGYIWKDRQLQ